MRVEDTGGEGHVSLVALATELEELLAQFEPRLHFLTSRLTLVQRHRPAASQDNIKIYMIHDMYFKYIKTLITIQYSHIDFDVLAGGSTLLKTRTQLGHRCREPRQQQHSATKISVTTTNFICMKASNLSTSSSDFFCPPVSSLSETFASSRCTDKNETNLQ